MEQLTFEFVFNGSKNVCSHSKSGQKKEMDKLYNSISNISTSMFIKANTIANKAVSLKFGYSKPLKKNQMTQDMLELRQVILEQVTSLMVAKSLGVDIPHVSNVIYNNLNVGTSA